MKVFVYWNLHKKVWSVKALQGLQKGRVVAHRNDVMIENAEFRVSEAGRQRVLREKRKNVHAGVVGEWVDSPLQTLESAHHVTYNPYKYESFVFANTDEPVYNAGVARCVTVDGKGCIFV